MGTQENMYERIMKRPTATDINPKELQNFLENNGFKLKRTRGSHYIYGYPEYPKIIVIPMHKPVGPAYIDIIRDVIMECGEK